MLTEDGTQFWQNWFDAIEKEEQVDEWNPLAFTDLTEGIEAINARYNEGRPAVIPDSFTPSNIMGSKVNMPNMTDETYSRLQAEEDTVAMLNNLGYENSSDLRKNVSGSHNDLHVNLGIANSIYDQKKTGFEPRGGSARDVDISGWEDRPLGSYGLMEEGKDDSIFGNDLFSFIAAAAAPFTGGLSVAAQQALRAADGDTLKGSDYTSAALALAPGAGRLAQGGSFVAEGAQANLLGGVNAVRDNDYNSQRPNQQASQTEAEKEFESGARAPTIGNQTVGNRPGWNWGIVNGEWQAVPATEEGGGSQAPRPASESESSTPGSILESVWGIKTPGSSAGNNQATGPNMPTGASTNTGGDTAQDEIGQAENQNTGNVPWFEVRGGVVTIPDFETGERKEVDSSQYEGYGIDNTVDGDYNDNGSPYVTTDQNNEAPAAEEEGPLTPEGTALWEAIIAANNANPQTESPTNQVEESTSSVEESTSEVEEPSETNGGLTPAGIEWWENVIAASNPTANPGSDGSGSEGSGDGDGEGDGDGDGDGELDPSQFSGGLFGQGSDNDLFPYTTVKSQSPANIQLFDYVAALGNR